MRFAPSTTNVYLSFTVYLLATMILCFTAEPALAQFDRPLSTDLILRRAPRVTAQKVEDGSASLMDFALAAREPSSQAAAPPEEAPYVGCLTRQEGSLWRSGSTYIASLTPDGRVFVHAKNMVPSGRQLKPLIYGAILQALGINSSELAGPAAIQACQGAISRDGGYAAIPLLPTSRGQLDPTLPALVALALVCLTSQMPLQIPKRCSITNLTPVISREENSH